MYQLNHISCKFLHVATKYYIGVAISVIFDVLVEVIIVTGFAKTLHVRTKIEILFVAFYNSHTHSLSKHSNKTAIDNLHVAFC